jgi:hypothetical protein
MSEENVSNQDLLPPECPTSHQSFAETDVSQAKPEPTSRPAGSA